MKTFFDWITLIENENLEDHPFKYVEQYKSFIIKVINAEIQKYKPVVEEAIKRVNVAKASKNEIAVNKAVAHANTVGKIAKGFQELIEFARNLYPETENLDNIRREMIEAINEVSQKYSATNYMELLRFFDRVPANISSAYDSEYRGMSPSQRRARANAQRLFRNKQIST